MPRVSKFEISLDLISNKLSHAEICRNSSAQHALVAAIGVVKSPVEILSLKRLADGCNTGRGAVGCGGGRVERLGGGREIGGYLGLHCLKSCEVTWYAAA